MRSFVGWIQSLPFAVKAAHAKRTGDDDAVIENYSRAIELSPEDLDYYHGRGDAYWHKKELGLAVADFSHAIELKPDNFYAHMRRGQIYSERGYVNQAIRDFNFVLEVMDMPKAYFWRARCLAEVKEYDKALADLDEALRYEPNCEAYQQLHDECLHELEVTEESVEAMAA